MRHAVAVGWLAGMILILACLPLLAALAAPFAAAGAVLAWWRWGGNLRLLPQLAAELIRLREHVRKLIKETGSAVDRA